MKVFDDELALGRHARPSTKRHPDREQLGSSGGSRTADLGSTGAPAASAASLQRDEDEDDDDALSIQRVAAENEEEEFEKELAET